MWIKNVAINSYFYALNGHFLALELALDLISLFISHSESVVIYFVFIKCCYDKMIMVSVDRLLKSRSLSNDCGYNILHMLIILTKRRQKEDNE